MPTIQELLQFYFTPTRLEKLAHNIIPIPLNELNNNNIEILKEITKRVGESSFKNSGNNFIPQVFRKFKDYINKKEIYFERRELRTLTYTLSYTEQNWKSIFSNNEELNVALNILNQNWKDSFLIGLMDCFLKNWETKFQESLKILEKFILQKLELYQGSRNILISFKKNLNFYSKTKNGDEVLGLTLARLKEPIQNATKILGIPDTWITYSYFSKVIVAYYEKIKENIEKEIDNLNEILINHNSLITNKRLMSKIIIQSNQPEFVFLQDKIKRLAFQRIGDPSNIVKWTVFENATEKEKEEIKKAKDILNEWITKEFINVFFDVCINDKRRKEFWLKFVSKISYFKICGSKSIQQKLKLDKRIAEYVDARFVRVTSNQNISAFILYSRNYMLIEFSDSGYAFYAYKNDSSYKPNLSESINSVDGLKNKDLQMAVTRKYSDVLEHYNEGRLFHKDGKQQNGSTIEWENVFEWWFKQYNVF